MEKRFKCVRDFLKTGEEIYTVFTMASRMLCIDSELPGLFEEFLQLMEAPPGNGEKLVLLPSLVLRRGRILPAGFICRLEDFPEQAPLIEEWERYVPDPDDMLPDTPRQLCLILQAPQRRLELASFSDLLPPLVPWSEVSAPMDILVDSVRSAAFVAAWTLIHRKQEYSFVPELLQDPETPEAAALPTNLYSALSRYKALRRSFSRVTEAREKA